MVEEIVAIGDMSFSHGLTVNQAIMHLIKSAVGTGILAMPVAMSQSGLIPGTLMTFFIGLIAIHMMHLLIKAYRRLQIIFPDHPPKDYSETVEASISIMPILLQRRLKWLKPLTNICFVLSQFGYMVVYHLFLAENTKAIVADVYNSSTNSNKTNSSIQSELPLFSYQLMVTIPIICVVFIRSLRSLAFISTVSNVFSMCGLILILGYCWQNPLPVEELALSKSPEHMCLAFGVIIFAFASINVLLTIEQEMTYKPGMNNFTGVINTSMSLVIILHYTVGFYGYFRFGSSVLGAITYAVPVEASIFGLAKPLYTVSILANYALQFNVVFLLFWEWVLPHLGPSQGMKLLADITLRLAFVFLCLALGMIIPRVDLMIALVGAITCSAISLIFPSFIDSVILLYDTTDDLENVNKDPKENKVMETDMLILNESISSNVSHQHVRSTRVYLLVIKNICIGLLGLFGAIDVLYVTGREIHDAFNK